MNENRNEKNVQEGPNEEVVYKSTRSNITRTELLIPNKKYGGINLFLYFAAISANLLTFSAGTVVTWSSPVLPKLNGNGDPDLNPLPAPLTPHEGSWIVSLLSLGAPFGCIVALRNADKVGRKRTLLLASLPMLVSLLMMAFARSVHMMYLSRFNAGVGLGWIVSVVPMYVGEIAEDHNRGALGCMLGIFASSGMLLSFIIGPLLSVQAFTLTLIIPLVVFICIFGTFIPESPVYLISMEEQVKAFESLKKLRTKPDKAVERELSNLIKSVQESKINAKGMMDIFRSKGLRKGLLITTGLVFFQESAGLNIVLSFMESIFEHAGVGKKSSTAVIITGIVQLATIIVASLTVEKLGRKILLLISLAGTGVSLFLLGIFFYWKSNGNHIIDSIPWFPVASLVMYMIFFNIGIGPVPWAILGEIFPANVKFVASSLTTKVFFLSSFVLSVYFPRLCQVAGMAISFWFLTVICAVGFLVVYIFVFETKGKTFAEIQQCLHGSSEATIENDV